MKKKKYVEATDVVAPIKQPSFVEVAMLVPLVINHFDTSMIKQQQVKVDWKLYRIEFRDDVAYIVREMCDRCGKVLIPRRKRMLREYKSKEFGTIYFEAGICNDCINASVYVDKYLDGTVLTEAEAKALFYKYGVDYERAWRVVLAAAPRIAMTEEEWKHRCNFFGGCAMCGGPIQIKASFFPRRFNGEHTAWNVIPLCESCMTTFYRGKLDVTKVCHNYKIFSTNSKFQKTKTIRMYLLTQMEKHDLYIEPLQEFRKRFFETKTLEGSL